MWLAPVGGDMATEQDMAERAAVTTYVPAYQRDVWDDHADELDMSRSEFVRSMVQAGRKGFDPRGRAGERAEDGHEDSTASDDGDDGDDGQADSVSETGGDDLKRRVLDLLKEDSRSWEELFAAVTDDVEERLDEAVGELQDQNRIRHSGRDGGYVVVE